MSGGRFNYNQHFINDIAGDIEDEIGRNKICWPWVSISDWRNEYNKQRYKPETIKEFKKAVKILREAYIYTQCIDWFLSGDDDEEDFHKRLKEELKQC